MGDLIVLGSKLLRFGNFDPLEIRKVSCITVNVNPQAVINEYGSNFVKYKQDPLVTIEAKNALHGNSECEFSNLMISLTNLDPTSACPLLWKTRK
jgi:hypothetical protein